MAAFYDDNANGIIPSLQASTLLAHVRAAAYNSSVRHGRRELPPLLLQGDPWIIAQNGDLPNWKLLQRELLQHCKDSTWSR